MLHVTRRRTFYISPFIVVITAVVDDVVVVVDDAVADEGDRTLADSMIPFSRSEPELVLMRRTEKVKNQDQDQDQNLDLDQDQYQEAKTGVIFSHKNKVGTKVR